MKHAYLIIANRNPEQLQKLITAIDDSRNDIYLLIDAKSSNFPTNFQCDYSNIILIDPIKIYWGSYSQIEAEMKLFSASVPYHYKYYHLLSGLDLPITNQDNIHKFFDNNLNYEFITYGDPINLKNGNINSRMNHHLFRNDYRTNKYFINYYRKIEQRILKLIPQYKIPKKYLCYGSNWLSIDDDLANIIVQAKNCIHSKFKYGFLVDEIFIPTLINYYPSIKRKVYYKKSVTNNPSEFQGNLRYINWWDGGPYTWRINDYNDLMSAKNNGHLFARKFDENVDNKIINKIIKNII